MAKSTHVFTVVQTTEDSTPKPPSITLPAGLPYSIRSLVGITVPLLKDTAIFNCRLL